MSVVAASVASLLNPIHDWVIASTPAVVSIARSNAGASTPECGALSIRKAMMLFTAKSAVAIAAHTAETQQTIPGMSFYCRQ